MRTFERTRPEGGAVIWCEYTDAEIRAMWTCGKAGHEKAIERGRDCVVVPCDDEAAVHLSRLFLREFASTNCLHYDGVTLSMYCGLASGGTDDVMRRIKCVRLRPGESILKHVVDSVMRERRTSMSERNATGRFVIEGGPGLWCLTDSSDQRTYISRDTGEALRDLLIRTFPLAQVPEHHSGKYGYCPKCNGNPCRQQSAQAEPEVRRHVLTDERCVAGECSVLDGVSHDGSCRRCRHCGAWVKNYPGRHWNTYGFNLDGCPGPAAPAPTIAQVVEACGGSELRIRFVAPTNEMDVTTVYVSVNDGDGTELHGSWTRHGDELALAHLFYHNAVQRWRDQRDQADEKLRKLGGGE